MDNQGQQAYCDGKPNGHGSRISCYRAAFSRGAWVPAASLDANLDAGRNVVPDANLDAGRNVAPDANLAWSPNADQTENQDVRLNENLGGVNPSRNAIQTMVQTMVQSACDPQGA